MKKFLLFVFVMLCFCVQRAEAIEVVRQKNAATYIVFPIIDADGDVVSSAAGLDSEIDTFGDGSAPDGFTDCTNEATEIGATGCYYLSLTAAEMNVDYVVVQVYSSTSGAKEQWILIRTMEDDPLNLATTDDGGTINVASGVVEANVEQIADDAVTDNADGVLEVNVAKWDDTAVSDTDGVPDVNVIEWDDAAITDADANPNTDVTTIGAGLITATVMATDSITSDELAATATAEIQAELEANGASILDTISDKLPTNYIMGSAVQTDKDDDIDAILVDTSTTLDDYIDTEVAAILADTGTDGVQVVGMKAAALADFFDTDSGTVYGSAVAGSVVKETADNAGSDWTANEKTELKTVLGITNTGTPDDTPSDGALFVVQGATFDTSTDSLEAIRNRGDAAWTGSGTSTSIRVDYQIPGISLGDTKSTRIALYITDAADDLPTTGEITPGTISIDRCARFGTVWTSIVSDAAMLEKAGMIYYDEVFDNTTGYRPGDVIRFTFKSQKVTISGNDHEISNSDGREFYRYIPRL